MAISVIEPAGSALDWTKHVLFKMILVIALGILATMVLCVTCCIVAAPIPIIGSFICTVILLPFLVFWRTYSIHFLAQFGPRYAPLAAGMSQVYGVPSPDVQPPQL